MAAPEPQTVREAARLAGVLAATRLASTASLDEPFAIVFEGEDTRWYGAMLAVPLPHPGLVIARGVPGLRYLRALAEADDSDIDPEIARGAVVLRIEHAPLESIPAARRSALRRARVVTEFAADLVSLDRGHDEAFVDRAELRRLLAAVRAVIAAADDPLLDPGTPREPGRLPTIRMTGEQRAPSVAVSIEDDGDPDGAARIAPRLAFWMAESAVEDGRWLVTLAVRDGGGRPVLQVLDRVGRRTLGGISLERSDADLAARTFLRGSWVDIDDDVQIARDIAFDDADVAALVRGPLEGAGVRCETVAGEAAVRETLDIFASENSDLRAEPAPSDESTRWSRAVEDSDRWIDERLRSERLPDARSEQLYYGTRWTDDVERVEGAYEALCEWAAFDHHRSPRAATAAERLLASGDLPDATRAVMEARVAAQTSLYRVESVDPENATAVLIDVFDGGRHEVTDPVVAEELDAGEHIALRIARTDDFDLVSIAGPVIAPDALAEALVVIGSTGERPRPEAFGRLWTWAAEELEDEEESPDDDEAAPDDPLEDADASRGPPGTGDG